MNISGASGKKHFLIIPYFQYNTSNTQWIIKSGSNSENTIASTSKLIISNLCRNTKNYIHFRNNILIYLLYLISTKKQWKTENLTNKYSIMEWFCSWTGHSIIVLSIPKRIKWKESFNQVNSSKNGSKYKKMINITLLAEDKRKQDLKDKTRNRRIKDWTISVKSIPTSACKGKTYRTQSNS